MGDRKTLILWDHDVLHILAVDPPSLSSCEISQMPDSDIIIGRNIDAAITSQKLVDFGLVVIFGLELLGVDQDLLCCLCIDLIGELLLA